MSNFVRGGQLITHSFRMNYQVWKILMRCVLAIMLSGVLYTFYNEALKKEKDNLEEAVFKSLIGQIKTLNTNKTRANILKIIDVNSLQIPNFVNKIKLLRLNWLILLMATVDFYK